MKSTSSKITKYSAYLIIVIGVLGLTGWIFDLTLLKSFYPDLISFKVNATVLIIITGFLLLFRIYQIKLSVHTNYELAFRILSALVIIIASATLFEYILGK